MRLAHLIPLRRGSPRKVRATLECKAKVLAKPPVINDRIGSLIDADRVIVRPAITKLDGKQVRFADRGCRRPATFWFGPRAT